MTQNYLEYNKTAKILHWLVALFIFTQYIIGYTMYSTGLWLWHKQLGVIILLLAAFRIFYRLTSSYPPLENELNKMSKILAHSVHGVLYLLLLFLPIGGILLIASRGVPFELLGINFPAIMAPLDEDKRNILRQLHWWGANTLVILALGHGFMAIIDTYLLKHNTLWRMLPNFKKK